jgi:hypothetical protein
LYLKFYSVEQEDSYDDDEDQFDYGEEDDGAPFGENNTGGGDFVENKYFIPNDLITQVQRGQEANIYRYVIPGFSII